MDQLAQALLNHPEIAKVEVHVSPRTTKSRYARGVARRRAETLRLALIERGLDPEMLTAVRPDATTRKDAPPVELRISEFRADLRLAGGG